ncbi:MAG: S1/P1 Nuclease, partial [Muribaculaceae bacterium]|nr:S1/P1 Nuclease [Muribaculaceae bacterium]
MKKSLIQAFALIGAMLMPVMAGAWGQKGHDVTAYLAEQHLTERTRAVVDSLLDGRSMVYWANWLDNASHTPEYAYSKTWHYKNVDEGVRYEEAQANPSGDAVTAIKSR